MNEASAPGSDRHRGECDHLEAVLTIVMMPALIASGSSGQAATTAARSGPRRGSHHRALTFSCPTRKCSLLLAGFETMHDPWKSLTHGGLFSIVRESF